VIARARVLTLAGPAGPRRGAALRDLGVLRRGWVEVTGGRIAAVGPGEPPRRPGATVIDAAGGVLLPAFVDCHTHACWAGERFGEFEEQVAGVPYLEILARGGGIMSTVRAVRGATREELREALLARLRKMALLGTGTVEVKSGYGLETGSELRMLRAIDEARRLAPLRVMATFLGAHALDPENPRFVEETIEETLPAVAAEFPGITADAYCERGAWSLADTRRYFERARALGCPLRVHTDQFSSLGATRLAIELGARSVDHLEALAEADLDAVARAAGTVAVALPCSGFHLDGRYAPARRLIDAGAAVALATNFNPGSAPTPSMPFILALAARKLRLSPAEAITAATWNGACVLGAEAEVGSIEPGKRADLQLWECGDERALCHEIAGPGPALVVLGGEVVRRG
jgi:imidazolonepropionase